ncbi:MAG: alpha/beta hydrolase [Sneathiellaceae bacterium]
MNRTLFAIHGAFSGSWCFDPLREVAAARDWELCGIDLEPQNGRTGPAGLQDYLAACLAAIDRMAGPPVVVGHSMGGLLAQQLAATGAVRGAILLAPAPPWGQFYATMQENVNVSGLLNLGPFWTQILPPDLGLAGDVLMRGLGAAARAEALSRLRPESGRVLFEINCWGWDLTRASAVASHRVRCPMLFVTGSEDAVISPATVRATAGRYGDLAACREYAGLGHFIFGEAAEAAVFRDCLDWLDALDRWGSA